jgi:hypothetical protein
MVKVKKVKSKVRTAKQDKPSMKMATDNYSPARKINKSNTWKKHTGTAEKFQGIDVFAAVDPYPQKERLDFRSAMNNPYVYRASRIAATFTAGQGYTTDIVPRQEEDLPDEQADAWASQTKIYVPYYDKEMTPEQINDKIDKMAIDMDLASNLFNGYFTALEQGRCVLALTPLATNEEGQFMMPEQIRLIRPEFTERPVINDDTSELEGVRIIGVRSPSRDNILPKNRMIYLMHGFNNELFSDYYGESKVSRIADEANTLNIILNQDYERAAESTWYKPPIYSVPIPPQEYGNEDAVLSDFLAKANDSKGQSIAVTGPSSPDEVGVTVIPGAPNADIGGLEIIRTGLIKAIITAYGLPGFMLAEGDIGKLGGNANIEEIDSYLNQEIRPERLILENIVQKQYFDVILAIMFGVEDATQIPVKIIFKFNKPRLVTLLTPDMFSVLMQMAQAGLIDESGIRDILGIEELDKETMTRGQAGGGNPQWNSYVGGATPVSTNGKYWPNEAIRARDMWKNQDVWGTESDFKPDVWAKMDVWPQGTPTSITDQWPTPQHLQWSQAGKTLQTAKKNRGAV